ncbi:MAG: YicC/YloC family endoribonuclease [Nitratireductor sp.]
MNLQSMTGYCYVEDKIAQLSWSWEIKSVNGKALDVRWKLPSGLDFLESELKAILSKKILRGNLQINLTLEDQATEKLPVLNENVLNSVLQMVETLNTKTNLAPPSVGDILSFKGVVDYKAATLEDDDDVALRNQAFLRSFEKAVSELEQARSFEGAQVAKVLQEQVSKIESLKERITKDESRTSSAIKNALSEKLSKILEDNSDLDPQRLHQEAAILATKADLQEELDRLDAHCVAARELLKSEGALGRKLDFLAQEFNRECNTICSKSIATNVTQAGLEMKVVIDQFREQIQNVQ